MEKTIIISDYDCMYYYSIFVNNKLYTRDDIEDNVNIPDIVLDIYNNYNTFDCDYQKLNELMKKYNYERTIICDNGYIEIIKKEI